MMHSSHYVFLCMCQMLVSLSLTHNPAVGLYMLLLSTSSFIHFFLSFIHFFLLSLFICCCTSFLFYLFLSFPQKISVSAFKSISSYLSLVYLVRFFV